MSEKSPAQEVYRNAMKKARPADHEWALQIIGGLERELNIWRDKAQEWEELTMLQSAELGRLEAEVERLRGFFETVLQPEGGAITATRHGKLGWRVDLHESVIGLTKEEAERVARYKLYFYRSGANVVGQLQCELSDLRKLLIGKMNEGVRNGYAVFTIEEIEQAIAQKDWQKKPLQKGGEK